MNKLTKKLTKTLTFEDERRSHWDALASLSWSRVGSLLLLVLVLILLASLENEKAKAREAQRVTELSQQLGEAQLDLEIKKLTYSALERDAEEVEAEEVQALLRRLSPNLRAFVSKTSGGEEMLPFINLAAKSTKVSFNLCVAVAAVESSLRPDARHVGSGATGLFQIMPICHKDVVGRLWGEEMLPEGDELLLNPQYNAMVGCTYLSWLIDQTATWDEALAAYNWGLGNVKGERNPNHWPREVQIYKNKVLDLALPSY